ncbi:hypothetical protein L2712_18820 [Shewanella marisflavi]|uniref:hypothetical protein n=1 Tax=Shewanella marisflavi TaxID=260364 RepID=UPI00200D6828|nr:hypothetical protein [Shewanella marisflavi]MCL1043684.1 hypothetical protein [Shewanella marisflavi]
MDTDLHLEAYEQMLASSNAEDSYLRQLFDIYHQRLLINPHVCQKLARQGISMDSIETHLIGYCDRTLNRYVSGASKVDGAGYRGTLRRMGLLKSSGHEIFRGCIVEPLFEGENIVAACGVKLNCPSRPAPRIIQWYRHRTYYHAVKFHLMIWGKRYVAH